MTVSAEERQDFLPGNERMIHQRSDIFSYSMDAVLLAKFARVSGAKRIIDLCAGTGAVPLMLSLRTKAKIEAMELQPLLCGLFERSIITNELSRQISVKEGDLRILQGMELGKYDLVTCNPPYFPVTAAKGVNENEWKTIARHEVSCTLTDAVAAAAALVKSKGKVAFVHRPERAAEIFAIMNQYHLAPKRIKYVHPKLTKAANIVLIEAVKDGNPGLTTEAPWVVYAEDGTYQKEFYKEYFEGGRTNE
ncbi:tRNA1(Val) (adenine(37)-N6)-methyltransferase [Alkalicoccus daliensis]|uniref:tRNA1(Val) A37 N6-methylase TrmN6 n=1 Tax=Alkalicoccus daliensis TaxID=745820 RepID=A0A1H0KT37_9BACI|nr:tRNA1(Val) (adenine(37)-N6)-methyltransferase [Alkalicoccus daliensis]SDO59128.1 tRNA1(Val) A37 N6-methylase TrmN6 [Alkalicoccus daliensis]